MVVTLKNTLVIFYEIKEMFIMQLNNLTHRHYLSETKPYVHSKTCVQMCLIALFVITKAKNNPNILPVANE